MAIEEPSKFAQLAAGLIPREAMLTVAQRLPGNLEGEDWELMLSVCAAIKQALPSANQQSPSSVLEFVLNAKTGRGGWFVNFANHRRQKEQSWVAYRENIDGGHSNSQFCGRFGRDPSCSSTQPCKKPNSP
jgi:hypothetical protein